MLSEWAFALLRYPVLLWASRDLIPVYSVTPDLGVAAVPRGRRR
jgi:hypothetical protein